MEAVPKPFPFFLEADLKDYCLVEIANLFLGLFFSLIMEQLENQEKSLVKLPQAENTCKTEPTHYYKQCPENFT